MSGFNFFKYTKPFIVLSIAIIVLGVICFGVRGVNLGVEYQAGSDISIATSQNITKKELRSDLRELKLDSSSITMNDDEVTIRVNNILDGEKVDKVTNYFEDKYDAKTNIGVISNVVKQELVKNAILSVIVALVGIILYISVRFKFSYAIGGVVSLFHDVLIIFALFAVFHLEISSMFIVAILTIIGYSINDTIVTFDRIREELSSVNGKKLTRVDIWSISNRAICETFIRSLHTFITTLIPIVILIILGSREILTFNLAMLIGLVAGVYSSIYIATVIFSAIEAKNIGKPKKKKVVYTDEYEEKLVKGINC